MPFHSFFAIFSPQQSMVPPRLLNGHLMLMPAFLYLPLLVDFYMTDT